MVDRPFFSSATATKLLGIARRGDATAKLLWVDEYTIRRTTRPSGWDTGSAETEAVLESGTCKLISTGPGAGDTADAVIVGLTPYRVRLPATTLLTDSGRDLITINGREFLVNDIARGDDNRTIVEASLTERTTGGA